MKNFMCTRCHKRPAVIFMSRMENGQMVNEGLCLQCAKELGIPQVKDLIDRMGISDEDIESMSNQIMDMMGDEDGFEPGGAMPFPMMNISASRFSRRRKISRLNPRNRLRMNRVLRPRRKNAGR